MQEIPQNLPHTSILSQSAWRDSKSTQCRACLHPQESWNDGQIVIWQPPSGWELFYWVSSFATAIVSIDNAIEISPYVLKFNWETCRKLKAPSTRRKTVEARMHISALPFHPILSLTFNFSKSPIKIKHSYVVLTILLN